MEDMKKWLIWCAGIMMIGTLVVSCDKEFLSSSYKCNFLVQD